MKLKSVIKENNPYLKFNTCIEMENGICGKLIKINDIETHYIITKDCKIINIETGYEKKPYIGKTLVYKHVNIHYYDGEKYVYKTETIHRLMAYAYIENPDNKTVVNHKNGDKLDNDLENLEWCTYSENSIHAYKHGLSKVPTPLSGENCNLTKYTKNDVINVCEMLKRGHPPKYISKTLNVGYDFVLKIRRKETWKEITTTYKFPICKKSSKNFSIIELLEIENHARSGKTTREIIDIMNWEYDEKIRSNVKYYVSCVKNGRRFVFYI